MGIGGNVNIDEDRTLDTTSIVDVAQQLARKAAVEGEGGERKNLCPSPYRSRRPSVHVAAHL